MNSKGNMKPEHDRHSFEWVGDRIVPVTLPKEYQGGDEEDDDTWLRRLGFEPNGCLTGQNTVDHLNTCVVMYTATHNQCYHFACELRILDSSYVVFLPSLDGLVRFLSLTRFASHE